MIGVNLMPVAHVVARRRRRRIRLWALVTASTATLGAVPVALELSRHQQVQTLKSDRTATSAEIETISGKLNKLGIETRQLESQIVRAEALRTKRSWARLIGVVAQSLPEEVWLTAIATDPPTARRGTQDRRTERQLAVAGADGENDVVMLEAPKVMTIDGYAIEQGHIWDFVTRLSSTNAFRTVRLQKSVVQPVFESLAVKFQIVCDWDRGPRT